MITFYKQYILYHGGHFMKKILFQGDSITDVGRQKEIGNPFNAMGGGYPLLLRSRLYLDHPGEYECLNRGISGNRVVDLYARVQRDILNIVPDYLSILIGVNDVWHGLIDNPNGVSAEKFEMVYSLLLEEVKEALPQVQLLILEPFVLPGTATQVEEAPERWEIFSREVPLRAAAAKRVAEKFGAKFIPLQEKFDAACRLMPPAYWLRDGVHPTEAGHELIAREWMKAFEKMA